MNEQVEYRLVPLRGVAKGRNGDYRAIIDNNGRTLGTDAVLRETIERYQFRIAPNLLKTYVSAVLETMMANTAQDGRRRRFEDFFTVRLDIRGTFAGRDSKPDGSQRAVLNLQPMGEFRRATRRVGLRNEATRRRIYLSGVDTLTTVATDAPHRDGEIVWGKVLHFYGHGFVPVLATDSLDWSFTDADGAVRSGFLPQPWRVEDGGKAFDLLDVPWPEDLPEDATGRVVTFTLRSRGGDPEAEEQVRSVTARVVPYTPLSEEERARHAAEVARIEAENAAALAAYHARLAEKQLKG